MKMNNIEILEALNSEIQNPLHWTKEDQNNAISSAVNALKKINNALPRLDACRDSNEELEEHYRLNKKLDAYEFTNEQLYQSKKIAYAEAIELLR